MFCRMKFLPQCNNGAHSACKGVLTRSSVSLLFAPTVDCLLLYNTRARVLHYKMPSGGELDTARGRNKAVRGESMPRGVKSDVAGRQNDAALGRNNAARGRINAVQRQKNAARGQKNVRGTSDRRFREHKSRLSICYHMLIKLSLQAFLSKLRCGNRKFFAEILYGISNYASPP